MSYSIGGATIMAMDFTRSWGLSPASASIAAVGLGTPAEAVVRSHSKEEIDRVCEYIVANRDNPRLVKLTERLLEKFSDLHGKANNGQ
jgi:hypothetical protein